MACRARRQQGAGLVLDVGDLLEARQVRRQRSPVGPPLPGPLGPFYGIGGLLAGKVLGLDLLGLLEPQQQLIDRQALGPAAKAMTLQLLDDLAQPLVLGALRREHRPKRDRIVGLRFGRVAQKSESSIDSSSLPVRSGSARRDRNLRFASLMHVAPVKAFEQRLKQSHRQPHDAVGDGGPLDLPSSSLFENRQTPLPSK